jgi:enoyl-CoA hydratase
MSSIKKHAVGHVLILEMDVPESRNALSKELQAELITELDSAPAEGFRVAVLKGSSTVFSSGYNVSPVGRSNYVGENEVFADVQRLRDHVDFLLRLRRVQMPVVAQVRGYCLAGGTDLMLATDIAIVADDAKIGVPNVRSFGISLFSTLWPLLIGPMRSKLMMFTGDSITGKQASDWGLAALSAPAESLDSTVMQLASRMALMPPDLLSASKIAANRMMEIVGLEALLQSAIEVDVLAHFSGSIVDYWKKVKTDGLRSVIRERDAPYAQGGLAELIGLPPLP